MREPSRVERAILARLLSVDFDGAGPLRAQVRAIRGVEPDCGCGCPSIAADVDRGAAPPSPSASPLPAELAELTRQDGIPRTVLCFVDAGYLSNLECEYYDDARPEWPDPDRCAVLVRDADRYLEAVALPQGPVVRPHDPHDRWVSFEPRAGGGFCATTRTRYRESYAADGSALSRVLVS